VKQIEKTSFAGGTTGLPFSMTPWQRFLNGLVSPHGEAAFGIESLIKMYSSQ
jgi:hypothetical protein